MKKLALLVITFLIVGVINAQTTYTWIGASGGSWAVSTNWSPTRTTPATTDIIQFNSGATLTVTAVPSQTIRQLLVSGNTNVSLQAATTNILQINGPTTTNNLSIASGSTLQLGTGTGTLTLNFLTTASQRGDISGTLALNLNSTFTTTTVATTVVTVANGGVITNNNGTVTSSVATLSFAAGSIYNHARNGGAIPTATWNVTSLCNVTGIVATAPTAFTGTFGNVIWNCASQSVANAPFTAASTVAGNLTITAGTLGTGAFTIGIAKDLTNNGTLNTAGGVLNMNGTAAAQTISGSGVWTTGTTGRINSLTVNNANGVTLNPTVALQTALTLTAGTLTATNLTIGVAATNFTTFRTTGSLANVPAWGYTTGAYAITYNSGTAINTGNELPPAATPTNGVMTVAVANTNITLQANANIGSLTTSFASNTFNLNGFTLGLSRLNPISNTGVITANAAGSTLTFNGTVAQTFTLAGTYTGSLISNIVIDNSFSTSGLTLGTTNINVGTLTVNASRFFTLGGFNINIKNDLTNNGTITSTTVGSTITMNGTVAQNINGTGVWTTGTAGRLLNLTVNNSAGVTMNSTFAVQTGLILTAGVLTSSTLTIGVPATAVGITRTAGSLANVPNWGYTTGAYSILYNGGAAINTGNELPPATTPTNGVLIASLLNTNVTLQANANIGTLTTNVASNATFNLNGFTLGLSLANPISNMGVITANAPGSTIILNGTVAQSLVTNTGTYSGNLINNIVINNTSAGGVSLGGQSATLGFNNVTINTSRLLNLNGATLRVAGLWTNSGTLTANNSGATIALNGSSPQTFTVGTYTGSSIGSGNLATSGGLVINNSAGVTLGSPLTVAVLTLTNGILNCTSTNFVTVAGTGAACTNLGTGTSFVNGPLVRSLPATLVAGSTYSFPVGKSAYNLFELISPTTTLATTIRVEVFDAAAGGTDGIAFSSLPNPDKHWQATVLTGALTASGTIRLGDAVNVPTATSVIGNSATVAGTYSPIGGANAGNFISSTSPAPVGLGFFKIGTEGCLGNNVTTTTYTIGTTGADFTKITNAVAALNGALVCGNIIFELQPDYVGTSGETFPITINAANYTSGPWNVTFRPASTVASNLTTSGTSTSQIFNFNGIDRLTFDGRPGGAGTTIRWVIANTSTAGQVIAFNNDATNNTLRYIQVEGVNTTVPGTGAYTNAGLIAFGNTAPAFGNEFNVIDNCFIKDGASLPLNAIYSYGLSTAGLGNDNNQITNTRLANVWAAATSTSFINLQTGNSAWTINGNSFYQTASRTGTTGTSTHTMILISNTSGNGFTINNNFIGGTAASAGGTPWTQTGIADARFNGMTLSVGSATASNVQGNTFGNIAWAGNGTSTTTSAMFHAIYVTNGLINIGTTTGNIIGNATYPITITFNNTTLSQAGTAYGIYNNSPNGQINIQNNTISSITGAITANTSFNFSAIVFGAGTGSAPSRIINGNTISNITIAGSISSAGTSNLYGIVWATGGASAGEINNNTIFSLTNNYSGSTIGSQVVGIRLSNTPNAFTITGNTIYSLSCAATHTSTTTSSAAIGISYTASVSSGHIISNNTIHSLSATATAAAANVIGIYYSPAISGTGNSIDGNLIHSLALSTSSASGSINGIYLNQGTTTVSNNMIRLGINAAGSSLTTGYAINGINEILTLNNFYSNSVYIGGTGVASSTSPTYALLSAGTGTRAIQNNIFWNARSNAAGTAKHFAIRYATATGLTCSFNDLLATGTGAVLGNIGGTDNTSLAALSANSISADPMFINPTGNAASVDLHIQGPPTATPIEGIGVATPVLIDFDNQTRASFTAEDIGADAAVFIPIDQTAPTVIYTPFGGACNSIGAGTYNVANVAITDASGVNTTAGTKPRIYFKKSTDTNDLTGWKFVEANGTTSPFNFDIDFSLLNAGFVSAGDIIQYFVVAQDEGTYVVTPNIAINSGTFATNPNSVALTSTAFPIGGTINTFTVLPCEGTVTVGSTSTYTSFTRSDGIFNTINQATLTGDLVINVESNITIEDGTVALNQWAESGVGNYTVTIQSSTPGTNHDIASAAGFAGGLFRINGADRVTFNGGTGSARDLTFRNPSTANTAATFVYLNDATNNTMNNCIIEGAGTSTTLGTLMFSTAAATGTGNDNNTITNCDIRDLTVGSGTPYNAVYALGTAARENSGNTISNCNIFNYYVSNAVSNGVLIAANNSGFTIDNNKFYQTVSRINHTSEHYAIQVTQALAGGTTTISNNTIGYASNTGTGIYTLTNASGNSRFNAIYVNAGTTSITGNTIQGITFTSNTGGANITPVLFSGISLLAGNSTITGNTIGSTTSTAAGTKITIASNVGTVGMTYGIRSASTGTLNISNNNIGNISLSSSSTTNGVTFYGINTTAGVNTISGNTIGSETLANSIQITNTTGTNNGCSIQGIINSATSGAQPITNNIIANLTNNNNSGNSATVATGGVGGISVSGAGQYTITGNSIKNLSTATTYSAATGPAAFGIVSSSTNAATNISNNLITDITSSLTTGSTQAVGISATAGVNTISNNKITVIRNNTQNITTVAASVGINMASTTAGQNISGNTIHSLITNSGLTVRAYGINYAGPTSGTNNIAANTIHSFTANNTTSSNIQAGIYLASGTCTVANNVIRLGLKADNSPVDYSNLLVGIQDASTSVNNIYYNSVFITGASGVGIAGNSYAMYRSATPGATETVKNNIFANNRTGGSSTSRHFAYASNTSGNIAMDNNIFQTNPAITTYYGFSIDGTNAVTGVTALHAIRASLAGQNLRSGVSTLAKINFMAATADTASFNLMLNDINCAVGAGLGITSITNDAYGFTTRATGSTAPTTIGAHQSSSFLPISTTDAANGTDIYTPLITAPTIPAQSAACGSTLTINTTATITDVGTGVDVTTMPTLWWRLSSGTWAGVPASSYTGSTYNFSFNITGLTTGQTYEYYVAAQDYAATPNIWYSSFTSTTPVHADPSATGSPFGSGITSFATNSATPLSGTVTVGATGGATYTSLSRFDGLFAAINANGLSGNLTVLVRSNTAEDGNQPLNQWSEYCGTGYKILIAPEDPSIKTLSGSLLGMGLIQLDGADRVTIDGRYNNTGTTRYLKFVNTYSGSGGSENDVFRFGSTATNDTIRFCDIECSSTKEAGGAINISTNSSNIVIDKNLIHGGTSWTSNCILADGSSNITITNNELYNFSIASGLRAYGIRVNAGNGSNWTITGNSVYNTGTNTIGLQSGISFLPGTTSTGNTISNNYIGGSAANAGACTSCGNKMWRNGYSPTSTLNELVGIGVSAGSVTVSNNTIKRIWNSDPYYSAIVGVQVAGSTAIVSNNTLGGTYLADYQTDPANADALQVDGGADISFPGYLYGITSLASSAITIDANIFNIMLQNGATSGGALTSILVQGSGVATITNNDNATNGNQETWGIYGWYSYGIWLEPSASSSGHLIANNKMVTPRILGSGISQVAAVGIYVNILGSRTVSGTIKNNTVTDNYTVENSGITEGIYVTAQSGNSSSSGNWDIINNMVYLSNPGQTLIRTEIDGIDVALNSSSTVNVHYNTVWVDGFNRNNTTTLANPSTSFLSLPGVSGNATLNIRNNIFINTRQGGSPNSDTYHTAIWRNTASTSGFSSDNNLFMIRTGATYSRMAVWGLNSMFNLVTWQGFSSGDANSYQATWNNSTSTFSTNNLNPAALFTQSSGVADLRIDLTDGESYQFIDALGAVVATTTDIDGETRNVTTPDIGADEFAACSITANTVTSAQTICSGTAPALLDGSIPTTTPASPTYQWESSTTSATAGFSAISGATAEDYTPGALTQTTWFRRVVYASSCSNNSTAVQITVNPIPTANAGANQTICYSGGTITGASATNNNGFSWSTSGTGTFSPNNTTLAATYIPSAGDITSGTVTLTLTATNSGCTDATDSKDVTIIMANNWIGSTSTDWFTSSNWCLNGAIPTATTNVAIPSSLVTDFDPLVNGAGAVCGSIFVNANGIIGIAGGNNLDIHGDWNNSGTFDYNTSTVTFKGSTNTNIGGASSPHTFYNLTVNKVSATAPVISTDNINVINQTTITQGVFKIDATTVVDLGSVNTVISSNGTLHVNGGDATATGITSAGVVNPETGTLDVSNGIVFTGGAFNQSTATVTLSKGGANSNTAAVFTADGNTAINITGGSVIFQLANAGTAGDVSIASGAGTKTITGGTFQFGNAATTSSQVFKVDNNAVDFNNFTVDNSNATTPTVRLTNNAAINSQGVLAVNSTLDLNQRLFLINNNSASAITRTSPGYVMSESQNGSSRIVWNLGGTTGTNYTFPLGNAAGTYMPITMNLNSGNIGFAGISSYKSIGATSGNWPLGSEAVTSVANPGQAVQRFWHLESSASPTTYNVDVTFSFDNTEDPTLGLSSVVKMQRYNKPTNSWDFALPGQVFANTTTRTVMVPGITKFSWWGGGNDASNNNPLPIELTNFKASCDGNEVRINWTTASEVNNDYFTVQRSADLVTFDNIAVVEGAGNSNTALNYDAIDNNPVDGIAYYRLVQTDFNGQTETFSPVAVTCSSRPVDVVSVYPNPAQNELNINVNLTGNDHGTLVVYNHLGQQVFTRTINADKGFNNYTLDVSGFAAGQYFVNINLGSRVLPVQKLVITR
jgi:hypothetical protein